MKKLFFSIFLFVVSASSTSALELKATLIDGYKSGIKIQDNLVTTNGTEVFTINTSGFSYRTGAGTYAQTYANQTVTDFLTIDPTQGSQFYSVGNGSANGTNAILSCYGSDPGGFNNYVSFMVNNQNQTDIRAVISYICTPGYTLPTGFSWLTNTYTGISAPTVQPLKENIAGLVCDTYFLPNMADVSWYTNFGALPNRDVFREDKSLIQTGTGANGATDLDVVAIIGASTGATLPIGSISYPGTTYADIADLGYNGQPVAIYSWIKRGGSIAGWNVIQMNGVNTSGFFGKYGTFEGKSTDGITNQMAMYGTGTIAEANLFNKKIGTTWQVFAPVSGFSGIRVGYAPYTQRKSCYLPSINSCEWKIEGGKNSCGPVISQNFQVGICSVAGSGSLYGSGSCVPVVNSSGQVVDAGILPGEGTIITLPDGTTKLVRISPDKINILFDCPNSQDQPWYKYIFSCAAEVIGNISNKVTGSTNSVISAQVGTYSNERLYTGSFSGLIQNFGNGQNPLVGTGAKTNTGALLMAIKGKLDTVGQPGPEIWQKMFTGGVAIGLLLMILSILAMIISSIRDRGGNINKK